MLLLRRDGTGIEITDGGPGRRAAGRWGSTQRGVPLTFSGAGGRWAPRAAAAGREVPGQLAEEARGQLQGRGAAASGGHPAAPSHTGLLGLPAEGDGVRRGAGRDANPRSAAHRCRHAQLARRVSLKQPWNRGTPTNLRLPINFWCFFLCLALIFRFPPALKDAQCARVHWCAVHRAVVSPAYRGWIADRGEVGGRLDSCSLYSWSAAARGYTCFGFFLSG